jgi:hypothetical protein
LRLGGTHARFDARTLACAQVKMLADSQGKFSQAIGQLVDKGASMGMRCQRFAMVSSIALCRAYACVHVRACMARAPSSGRSMELTCV